MLSFPHPSPSATPSPSRGEGRDGASRASGRFSLKVVFLELGDFRQWAQPMLAPLDPELIFRDQIGRNFIQAAERDFGFAVAHPWNAAAAGGAEASVGIGAGEAGLLLEGFDRPHSIGREWCAAALSAVGAVADAHAKRIATHVERHTTAKTASGADWRNMTLHGKSPSRTNGDTCQFVPTYQWGQFYS